MSDKTDAEILAEAREYMEEHGRITGTMANENGVCALGAITYSQSLYNLDEEDVRSSDFGLNGALHTLAEVIRKEHADAFEDGRLFSDDYVVVRFNDHLCGAPEHDQKVLDIFAKAEKIALNDGIDPDAA